MHYFLSNPRVFDHPLHLSQQEQAHPDEVLIQFCTDYRLHELRYYHWSQLEVCLCTDNVSFHEPDERADLLYLHLRMERALEAIFLLFKPETATT